MPNKEKCFIIMPLTTPENLVTVYRDGKDHFKHVLECLFIPAIEKAGFTAEPPIAKGSDLIHAEIIKSLEQAGIVMCDMSTLNPNVFFEFGIRTSLNKPVCVVKDELTEKVPFDTGIINYQEYNSAIDAWSLVVEVDKIAKHITASVERSKGENTLWKYLGFKSEAMPIKGVTDTDSKLDYLTYQIGALTQNLDRIHNRTEKEEYVSVPKIFDDSITHNMLDVIEKRLPKGSHVRSIDVNGGVTIEYTGEISLGARQLISSTILKRFGKKVEFIKVGSTKNEA